MIYRDPIIKKGIVSWSTHWLIIGLKSPSHNIFDQANLLIIVVGVVSSHNVLGKHCNRKSKGHKPLLYAAYTFIIADYITIGILLLISDRYHIFRRDDSVHTAIHIAKKAICELRPLVVHRGCNFHWILSANKPLWPCNIKLWYIVIEWNPMLRWRDPMVV